MTHPEPPLQATEALAELQMEVRAARMMLAVWPATDQVRKAREALSLAADAVADALAALDGAV